MLSSLDLQVLQLRPQKLTKTVTAIFCLNFGNSIYEKHFRYRQDATSTGNHPQSGSVPSGMYLNGNKWSMVDQ